MPQLNFETYVSQYFWFLVIFFVFYLFIFFQFLPRISRVFKLRRKATSFLNAGSESTIETGLSSKEAFRVNSHNLSTIIEQTAPRILDPSHINNSAMARFLKLRKNVQNSI